MLVLFDIDGTLLLTGSAGLGALREAWSAVHGAELVLRRTRLAGSLDPVIWRELCEENGVDSTPEREALFRTTYARVLADRLERERTARLLAGAAELVERLAATEAVTLGLLTGNFPETGRVKLASAGLDPDVFRVAAWGDDGASRRALPPVAMRRWEERTGAPSRADRVLIVGDTPNDVDCARANGCRSLAVATGHFGLEELVRTGADRAVPDLSDTEELLGWILG